jgi:hypothetical protein
MNSFPYYLISCFFSIDAVWNVQLGEDPFSTKVGKLSTKLQDTFHGNSDLRFALDEEAVKQFEENFTETADFGALTVDSTSKALSAAMKKDLTKEDGEEKDSQQKKKEELMKDILKLNSLL